MWQAERPDCTQIGLPGFFDKFLANNFLLESQTTGEVERPQIEFLLGTAVRGQVPGQ
jgi:hypothetical protein